MLGVIYARYSSDNQRDESIDGQLRVCKEYAAKNGIQLIGEYIDRAISGRKDNRPDFQRMIHDSKKKLFDVILVWKFDRFSRDRFDAAIYKKKLKNNGVKVVSVTEYIPDSKEGIFMESMLDGWAEYYVATLSENVSRGLEENALKGIYNGSTLIVGYKVDEQRHYQVDPLVGPYVTEAFELYANGKKVTEIAGFLNEKGVRMMNGKPVTFGTVSRMLHNRRYLGEYRYKDIVIKDAFPALVSEELFERVQARIERTRKAPAQHKAEDDYILTTKLFCGKCNAMMVGESGTSRANKEVHHYYKCVSVKKRRGCDKQTVRKKWIEDMVIEQIRTLIFDDKLVEAIADEVVAELGKEDTTVPLLEKKLAAIKKSLNNLVRAIEQGIFSETTKDRLDELEAEKEKTIQEIAEAKLKNEKPVIGKELIVGWIAHFRSFDFEKKEHRQQLVDHFVNAIYLYDDHFDLFFNYRDGLATVTFDEMQLAKAKERKKRTAPQSSDMELVSTPKRKPSEPDGFLFGRFLFSLTPARMDQKP